MKDIYKKIEEQCREIMRNHFIYETKFKCSLDKDDAEFYLYFKFDGLVYFEFTNVIVDKDMNILQYNFDVR